MSVDNAGWSRLTAEQQNRFLNQTGLDKLPETQTLPVDQYSVLVTIIGANEAKNYGFAPGGFNLADPQPPPPAEEKDVNWRALMILVGKVQMESGQLQLEDAVNALKADQVETEKMTDLQIASLNESIEKMEDAMGSGLFKKILGWVGAILGVAMAGVAMFATGGAAAPMFAVACLGLGMMVLEETGAMEKIVDAIVEHPMILSVISPLAGVILTALKETGVLDEEQLKMAVNITISVAMIVTSIVSAVCSFGMTATSSASTISTQAMKLLNNVARAGELASAGLQVATGVTGAVEGSQNAQSLQHQADAKEIAAVIARLQSLIAEGSDRLEQIMEKMRADMASISDIIKSIGDSEANIARNMGV